MNFLEKVEFWEQNRCDFFSKSRAVNQKLGSNWNFYCKLDLRSPFKKLKEKDKKQCKMTKKVKISYPSPEQKSA